MLPCPLHYLTGLNCPFCGAQRMLGALCHGNVVEAFWLNPALFIALPLGGVWWLWRREISPRTALFCLLGAVAWGIGRNLIANFNF